MLAIHYHGSASPPENANRRDCHLLKTLRLEGDEDLALLLASAVRCGS